MLYIKFINSKHLLFDFEQAEHIFQNLSKFRYFNINIFQILL